MFGAIALALTLQTPSPSFESLTLAALKSGGLTYQTARIDPGYQELYEQGLFQTPFYRAINDNPWRTPFYMQAIRADLADNATHPNVEMVSMARLLGFGTRRTLLGNPNATAEADAKGPQGFANELKSLAKRGAIASVPAIPSNVPPAVQTAAALILAVAEKAYDFRSLAFQKLDIAKAYDFLSKPGADEGDTKAFDQGLQISQGVDMGYLMAGGHDLTQAAQTASELIATVDPSLTYDFKVDTKWGRIELTSGEAKTQTGPVLLIISTGNTNDTYINIPSNSSATNWASVVIDNGGADKYLSDPALAATPVAKWDGRKKDNSLPGPAGSLFGYVVLIDRAGTDLYRSHRSGLGSGRYGTAVLLDLAGNDNYDAYANAEGYGEFGVGILEDVAGDDHYFGFTNIQGMGFVEGAGLLIDRSGNDSYIGNDTVIDFPSPQSDKHNVTMGQGAGYGFRRDYHDVHSLAGGVGILYDLKGNDTYSCGVFGQGVGYWMGVGALWDGGGDDHYLGQWYIQGAAAHYAIGYLEDEGGNDEYVGMMNMAQGAGHDFSIGYLIDHAGDDHYQAPNLSLGAGNANGMGIFADLAGSDTYEASGNTLGRAAEVDKPGLRGRAFSLGLFVDAGGTNHYPSGIAWAKDHTQSVNWTSKQVYPEESLMGIFWSIP